MSPRHIRRPRARHPPRSNTPPHDSSSHQDANEDDEAELERDLAASEPGEWLKLANCAMSAHISSSIPPKWGYRFATSIAKLGEEATLARQHLQLIPSKVRMVLWVHVSQAVALEVGPAPRHNLVTDSFP